MLNPKWKENDGKWEYIDDVGYILATVEEIDYSVEANLQFVFTIVGGETKNVKKRCEQALNAIHNAIQGPDNERFK